MNWIYYLVPSRQVVTIEWMARWRTVSTSITNAALGSWMAITRSPWSSLLHLLLPQMACSFSISTWIVSGENFCPSAASLSSLVGEWEWGQDSPVIIPCIHSGWEISMETLHLPVWTVSNKEDLFTLRVWIVEKSYGVWARRGWRVRQKWVLASAPCSSPYYLFYLWQVTSHLWLSFVVGEFGVMIPASGGGSEDEMKALEQCLASRSYSKIFINFSPSIISDRLSNTTGPQDSWCLTSWLSHWVTLCPLTGRFIISW